MCPHLFDRPLYPKLTHSHGAGTRPILGQRFRIATRAAPQCLKLAPAAPYLHPRAAQHLSCTARRLSMLLCTASLRGSSRASLRMQFSAPLHSAQGTSQYALRGSLWLGVVPTVHIKGWTGARTESPGNRLRQGVRLPYRPHAVPLRRPGCGCSAEGAGGPSVPARQDVRHGSG